jgi:prepilin-type N-terminal cleavage/methylation domain-containing protein
MDLREPGRKFRATVLAQSALLGPSTVNRQPSTVGGFSLIEVTVAIMVLSIGLLGLVGVLATVAHRQDFGQTVSIMTTLANTQLEQEKLLAYDSLVSITENFGSITDFPTYKRVTTVTPNAGDTLRTVVVLVTDHNGFQVSAQTMIAQ